MAGVLYDDGSIACDDDGLVIRRYYPWGGAKRIPYTAIRSLRRRPLRAISGKWRIYGSGDLVHWWNMDAKRPGKDEAIEIDIDRHFVPTITPDDVEKVASVLEARRTGPRQES
jgi:hypothetical protein